MLFNDERANLLLCDICYCDESLQSIEPLLYFFGLGRNLHELSTLQSRLQQLGTCFSMTSGLTYYSAISFTVIKAFRVQSSLSNIFGLGLNLPELSTLQSRLQQIGTCFSMMSVLTNYPVISVTVIKAFRVQSPFSIFWVGLKFT